MRTHSSISLQKMTVLSVLIALSLIVAKTLSVTLIAKQLTVSMAFLVNGMIGMVGGPVWAAISLGIVDVVDILSSGGAFNPLWTVMEMAQGFAYGYFLSGHLLAWDKPSSWGRVTLTTLVVMLIGTFIGTPLLIWLQFGTPIQAQYVTRIWKVLEIPVRIILSMMFYPLLQRIPEVQTLVKEK